MPRRLTPEPRCNPSNVESTQIRLVVPPELDMTKLLGQGDSLLRLIEDNFESDIAVRGNQITISGQSGDSQTVFDSASAVNPVRITINGTAILKKDAMIGAIRAARRSLAENAR